MFAHLEDCWYYELSISYSGAQLSLRHANQGKIGDEGNVVITEDQHFRLVTVETRLLTVEDYANTYGVNTGREIIICNRKVMEYCDMMWEWMQMAFIRCPLSR